MAFMTLTYTSKNKVFLHIFTAAFYWSFFFYNPKVGYSKVKEKKELTVIENVIFYSTLPKFDWSGMMKWGMECQEWNAEAIHYICGTQNLWNSI